MNPFPLGRALLGAAAILAISALLAWLSPAYISTEMSHRLLGALLGAVVVVYSNAIPKVLTARARRHCSPAADQAARRFAGWILVLGGFGYSFSWLLLPIGMASLAGGALLASAVLLAIVRCLRIGRSSSTT
jgi:uncharacterized membrane protein YeiB